MDKFFLKSIVGTGLLVLGGAVWGYACCSGHYETWKTGRIQFCNGEIFSLIRHEKHIAPFTWGPYGIPCGRGWQKSKTCCDEIFAIHVRGDGSPRVLPSSEESPFLKWLNSATEADKWTWMYHFAFCDKESVWALRPQSADTQAKVSPLSGDVIKISLETGATNLFSGPTNGDGFNGHPGGLGTMYCLDGKHLLYWDIDQLLWVPLDSPLDFREICKKTMDGWNLFRGDFLISRDGTEFHTFLGGLTNNGVVFHMNVQTGATLEELVCVPMKNASLRGWDISDATGIMRTVLLWQKGKECIVATPSGGILARWSSSADFGFVNINAEQLYVYGALFPAGLPDSYGRTSGNHMAHGQYPCSVFAKKWETEDIWLYEISRDKGTDH